MVCKSLTVEVEVNVSAKRMWHALFRDAHNALPLMASSHISSIQYIQGRGCNTGTIRLIKHPNKGCNGLTFTKERLEYIDNTNYYGQVTIVEGGDAQGRLLRYQHLTYSLKILPSSDSEQDYCNIQWFVEYETNDSGCSSSSSNSSRGSSTSVDVLKDYTLHVMRSVEEYLASHSDYLYALPN